MKKILLIANSARSMLLFRSGFMRKLLELGFFVVVCAPYDKEAFSELEGLGVSAVSLYIDRKSKNPFKEIISIVQLAKILLCYRPYATMFYTIKPVVYGSLVSRLLGVKNIFSMITGLGYVFVDETFFKKILRFFIKVAYKFVLNKNEKIFFLNSDDLSYFVDNGLVSDFKGQLIDGEGVDLKKYVCSVPSNDKIIFIFIGRLLKDKGLYEYIDAARLLKNKYKDAVFQVIGGIDDNPSGIKQDELQSWIEEGVIEYKGYLSDIRGVLRRSSVFILPSYREGMPVSILEAMATGRAIVTTDVPGCRETIEDGKNGFLVPVKDADGLAAAMERFIINPEIVIEMGKKSRQIAERKFCQNKVINDILTAMNLI